MIDSKITCPVLPKVELHRHLEGSLRLSTILDAARIHQITIPFDIASINQLVRVPAGERITYQRVPRGCWLPRFAPLHEP